MLPLAPHVKLGFFQLKVERQHPAHVVCVRQAHIHRRRTLQSVLCVLQGSFHRKLAQVHLTCVSYATLEHIQTLLDQANVLNVQQAQAVLFLEPTQTAHA